MSICLRRRWLALLVCGKIAAACCVFGADSNESTPRVSVGIKVGAPMRRFLTFDSTGGDAHTKHYTIGPAMDIGLHRGFGIEVGAMYKRIDEYSSSLTLLSVAPDTDENCPNCPTYRFNRISTVGRSWEFPVAGQYHISLRSMRPYVEGGLSFNHLSNIYGPLIGPTILGQTEQPSLNSFNRQGVLFGGGVEIKLHMIHVTPGLRYTRYSKGEPFLLAPNTVDFLVGFTF